MHKPLHDHLHLVLCYPWTSHLVLIYILVFLYINNILSLQLWRCTNPNVLLPCVSMDPCMCVCARV